MIVEQPATGPSTVVFTFWMVAIAVTVVAAPLAVAEPVIKEGDQWRTILDGKTIGPNFRREFDPVEARFVRLNILDAGDVPTIWEFQVFDRFEGPK